MIRPYVMFGCFSNFFGEYKVMNSLKTYLSLRHNEVIDVKSSPNFGPTLSIEIIYLFLKKKKVGVAAGNIMKPCSLFM